MKNTTAIDLSISAVCIALHIILEMFCTIRIGNELKITLAALPFVIVAIFRGPLYGFLTGLFGTFISQLITFGITATTPLWILPYALQGLFAGLIYHYGFKRRLSMKSVAVSVSVSGFIAVAFTWMASYFDGVIIYKYMTLPVLISLIPMKILVYVIISIINSIVSFSLTKALSRLDIVK